MQALERRRDRRALAVAVAGTVVLAWIALVAWGHSPYASYLDHGSGVDAITAGGASVLIAGWTLMTVAMMIPTSYPLFAHFEVVTRSRDDRRRLRLLLIAGYLA